MGWSILLYSHMFQYAFWISKLRDRHHAMTWNDGTGRHESSMKSECVCVLPRQVNLITHATASTNRQSSVATSIQPPRHYFVIYCHVDHLVHFSRSTKNHCTIAELPLLPALQVTTVETRNSSKKVKFNFKKYYYVFCGLSIAYCFLPFLINAVTTVFWLGNF